MPVLTGRLVEAERKSAAQRPRHHRATRRRLIVDSQLHLEHETIGLNSSAAKVRSERWRLAQAHELLIRFDDAHDRLPSTADEVEDWFCERPVERPIRPSDAAFERAKGIESLALVEQVADRLDVDRTD